MMGSPNTSRNLDSARLTAGWLMLSRSAVRVVLKRLEQ